MSTQFTNRQWRLPNEENKSKVSNYSMDFDGSSYIDLGNPSVLNFERTDAFSFSAWVNVSATANNTIISNQLAPSTNYRGYYFAVQSNKLNTIFRSTLSDRLIFNGASNLISGWNHVVFTYDGTATTSSGKFYINGSADTTTGSGTLTATAQSTDTVYLGCRSNADNFFNGKLDAVSIYNYALSSSQVTTLYGSSSTGIGNSMSLSPKPVAMYNLGDKSAFNNSNYLIPNSSLKDFVFDFDGTNDYIDTPQINLGSTNSISFWINRTSTAQGTLFGDPNGSSNYSLFIIPSTNNIYFRLGNGDSGYWQLTVSSGILNDGNWHHHCLTRDGVTINYYIDGVLQTNVTTNTLNASAGTNTTIENIMGKSDGTLPLSGQLSNVSLFNTVLPATGSNSVETLYNNGSPLTSMSGFSSLVSWYKLNASDTYDGSNWTIEDHAGSNDGTSSGMTQANLVQSDLSFTSGYSPYALSFDGANDYISIPNSTDFDLGSSFTISGWFNVTSYVSNMGYISFDGSSTRGWFLFHQSTNLALYDGTSVRTLSLNLQPTNQWNSYIITYDGTDLIFYLNGQQNSTQAVSSNLQTNGNGGQIGNQQFATGRFYNGSISNASIWNTALTSAQVSEIYSEGIPQNLSNHSAVSSLVSWWQLGSNSSFNTNWTVLDEKGSNNGTSSNMGEDAIVDGVGSYANGLSSGMGGDEVIGDAPYSTANSLSVNMDVLDRVEDTPS